MPRAGLTSALVPTLLEWGPHSSSQSRGEYRVSLASDGEKELLQECRFTSVPEGSYF